MIYLRYVNRDHSHPLYGRVGVKTRQGAGPGPRNCEVEFPDGTTVIAPYNNFRKATSADYEEEIWDTVPPPATSAAADGSSAGRHTRTTSAISAPEEGGT